MSQCEFCLESKRIIEDFKIKKDLEAVEMFEKILKTHEVIHEL